MPSQTLTDGAAEVVRQLLQDLGVGSDALARPLGPWPCYSYSMPDGPDDLVVVYETANDVHGRLMADGSYGLHRGIQVMVRASDPAAASAKADEALTALATRVAYRRVTVGANAYMVHAVSKLNGPIYVGKDAAARTHQYSVNGQASIAQL